MIGDGEKEMERGRLREPQLVFSMCMYKGGNGIPVTPPPPPTRRPFNPFKISPIK